MDDYLLTHIRLLNISIFNNPINKISNRSISAIVVGHKISQLNNFFHCIHRTTDNSARFLDWNHTRKIIQIIPYICNYGEIVSY